MKVTLDLINRIRDEVLSGKTKIQVSRELKINYRLVKHFTKDIPRRNVYTEEDIQKIRDMVTQLGSKAEAARRLGIPYYTVLRYTLDIKVRNKTNSLLSGEVRFINSIHIWGVIRLARTPKSKVTRIVKPITMRDSSRNTNFGKLIFTINKKNKNIGNSITRACIAHSSI